jgi:NSS family neurotransmitter:Na+ symporter
VFENIISFWLEKTNLTRPMACAINIGLILVLALPAIFSLGIWEKIAIPGIGGFLDMEDFIVSNLLLPLGSLMYVLFCTSRYGWGWKSFEGEINTGNGLKLPRFMRVYMSYVLPVIIFALLVYSIVGKFI